MGTLLLVTSIAMLFPIAVSLIYQENDFSPLLISAVVAFGMGLPLWWFSPSNYELTFRDAVLIAVFGWVIVSAVSALPFVFHGSIPVFTDAFFEMMSGYTTTGATILTDIESLPHGLLFWRSETHLLGGMGFLTLTLIFLPHGMAGVRIFRAESSPGQVITKEKFLPRNRDAMIWLWGIYLGLNLLQTLLLWGGGMSLFDSLCHAFGTVATAGFSPKNTSLGYYSNAYFDWVVTIFMFLGGMTFMLFYHMLKGEWNLVRVNTELRWYAVIIGFFCGISTLILWMSGTYDQFFDALRYASFQIISLLTTSGFTTADYELWPQSAQMLLYTVCFIGACAGSTTSGIKIVHFVIIWKYMVTTIKKMFFQPRTILPILLNQRAIDPFAINLSICYFIANIFLVLGGACVMVIIDPMDFQTGMSSVISAVMNVGPGFGDVGPSENYAHISTTGKWFLAWLMLVGRLEMFSALVLLFPSFWKR
ncbi:MAG TPA: TrkH family potassium uptake protein [Deltaproteobacteria bacterium]|nr:potassium transporter [Deltaproteobacteria bacterium]HHZ78444.1 TrkH family potassium uptake protein [Candidatus Lambdaproteobacteria bacterium]HIN47644.1 TrkH family potassium uptake protein [Deltaproteobacteria bacterium]HIO60766.1 TrkH family potassium uptake protein [Deltaproteobacteria bacterium]HIO82956.1 TrkH family potassium uptake protein [Deltaproteobacteria bacterium]